jgi:hypothetical protein
MDLKCFVPLPERVAFFLIAEMSTEFKSLSIMLCVNSQTQRVLCVWSLTNSDIQRLSNSSFSHDIIEYNNSILVNTTIYVLTMTSKQLKYFVKTLETHTYLPMASWLFFFTL